MASKYDWEFMRPLDQTAAIANMASGNQQINAGLQGIGGAVTGFADAMKQRNTDDIMNALYQAQTSADLPNAMQAVQALQQQYGRGYDQTAVRNAIDTRGSTLGQRDLQAINLQQAQAAQAAIPTLNQMAIAQAKARGVDTTGMEAAAALGIDTTGQINAFANNAVSDSRDARDFKWKDERDKRDYTYRVQQDAINNNRADLQLGASLAKNYVTEPTQGVTVDANGNIQYTQSSGTSFGDAFSTIMGNLFQTESGNRHRDNNGNLIQSPKGALGVAQIMPATAANPGYGMQPINLQTSTPEQQKAWAGEYISRIKKAHNFTDEQAVAAYNAGAGRVQKAIKEGGSNWKSKLPQETRNYIPKVMNGVGTAQSATRAVSSASLPIASLNKVQTDFNNALSKLDTDYNVDKAKSQVKGSLASTGKNVDTWVASKKETSWTGNSTNPIFTKAGDIGAMAMEDKAFMNLPGDAQNKVLEGAYGYLKNSGTFERVPNQQIRNFIHRESNNAVNASTNQYNTSRKALLESSYQTLVQQFKNAGVNPPNRESGYKMLDPSYQPPKPAPVAKPQAKATTPTPAKPAGRSIGVQTTTNKSYEANMDKQLADREKRKKAEWAEVEKKYLAKNPPKKEAPKISKPIFNTTTHLTQEQINKMIKNLQPR